MFDERHQKIVSRLFGIATTFMIISSIANVIKVSVIVRTRCNKFSAMTTKKLLRQIVLFDIDDTLTKPRNRVKEPMVKSLQSLRSIIDVGLVGGSDINKIAEQLAQDGDDDDHVTNLLQRFDYVFAENGLIAYKNGQMIGNQSILKHIGEENLQKVINFSMDYMSKLILPAKRGNFIEFRTGMINICPVGRSCNQIEREQFAKYDQENGVRKKFVQALTVEFSEKCGIKFAIGGQISIDVIPNGWDKTYCLQFLEENYDKIYFFGDKTYEGGNDYEIYNDKRTIGHSVTSPDHTLQLIQKTFLNGISE